MAAKYAQALLAIIFAGFPLYGVLLLGWSVREVVLLYWVENLIIGFWNIVRMLSLRSAPLPARVFTSGFFGFHFGFFCFVHGIFLLVLTQPGGFFGGSGLEGNPAGMLVSALTAFSSAGLSAVAMNFLMHGVGTVREHFLEGRWRTISLPKQMGQPYGHIVVVHLAIMATAFLQMLLPSAKLLLLLIILGKLVMDLRGIFASRALSATDDHPLEGA